MTKREDEQEEKEDMRKKESKDKVKVWSKYDCITDTSRNLIYRLRQHLEVGFLKMKKSKRKKRKEFLSRVEGKHERLKSEDKKWDLKQANLRIRLGPTKVLQFNYMHALKMDTRQTCFICKKHEKGQMLSCWFVLITEVMYLLGLEVVMIRSTFITFPFFILRFLPITSPTKVSACF